MVCPSKTVEGWLVTLAAGVARPADARRLDPVDEVRDLLTDKRFTWQGPRIYIELDPNTLPANVFLLR